MCRVRIRASDEILRSRSPRVPPQTMFGPEGRLYSGALDPKIGLRRHVRSRPIPRTLRVDIPRSFEARGRGASRTPGEPRPIGVPGMALCQKNLTATRPTPHKVHAGLPRGARCGLLFRRRSRPGSAGNHAPSGCRVRFCAGTTSRQRLASRTKCGPGSPGRRAASWFSRLRGRPPAHHRRGRSPPQQPTRDHVDGATLGRRDANASRRPRRPVLRAWSGTTAATGTGAVSVSVGDGTNPRRYTTIAGGTPALQASPFLAGWTWAHLQTSSGRENATTKSDAVQSTSQPLSIAMALRVFAMDALGDLRGSTAMVR